MAYEPEFPERNQLPGPGVTKQEWVLAFFVVRVVVVVCILASLMDTNVGGIQFQVEQNSMNAIYPL